MDPSPPYRVDASGGHGVQVGTEGLQVNIYQRETAAADRPADGTPEPVSNLDPRNPSFVGREHALEQVRSLLGERGRGGGRVVTRPRDRMGGIGKTQLAIEYAHRFAADYDVTWIVRSEQVDLIGGQLAQLAMSAGLVETDVTTPAAVQALNAAIATRTRWLIIFDNAEDPGQVAKWIPARGGHILITSRNPGWDEIAAPVDVELFERAEAVELLQRRVPGLSTRDAGLLAEVLGDLPLAVAQAATSLAETGMSAQDYLDLFHERATEILRRGKQMTYPTSLAATIEEAVEQLAQADPAAAQLLHLCAVLAPEPIPLNLFTQSADLLTEPLAGLARNRLSFYEVTKALSEHGLAGTSALGIQVHRVVQTIVRERIGAVEVAAARDQASVILAAAAPMDIEDPAGWPRWSALAPHVIALDPGSSANAGLRDAACRLMLYLLRRAEYGPAMKHTEQLHREWQARLGPDDPHTLKAATELAHALSIRGKIQAAHELVADTLDRYRRLLGEDHPDTLRSASDMSVILNQLGDHGRALELAEDVLSRRRRVLGEDHLDTLRSTLIHASALIVLGDHALGHLLEPDGLSRYLSEGRSQNIDAKAVLASTPLALGSFAKARAVAEDVLERCQRILGEDHPHTLDAKALLGAATRQLGDYAMAETILREVLARYQRVLGTEHPETVNAAAALANTLVELGDYAQAKALRTDVLAWRRAVLGEDHPYTLELRRDVAIAQAMTGQLFPARSALDDVLRRQRRVLGYDHPRTRRTQAVLEQVISMLGGAPKRPRKKR